MLLIPEELHFRVSTTDLQITYTESKGAILKFEAQNFNDFKSDRYRNIELHFKNVAELKCVSLNFFETNHGTFEINSISDDPVAYWKNNEIHPDPGVYTVSFSEVLRLRGSVYDPRNRLNLKHFLVVGYDSYIEIISSAYEVLIK